MLAIFFACWALLVQAQQCASLTKVLPVGIILPEGNFSVTVKFEWGTASLVVAGNDGTSAKSFLFNNDSNFQGLNISSFGDQMITNTSAPTSSAPTSSSQASAACQSSRSASLIYTIALLFGALGVVGLKRAEPLLLVVLCLCVVPFASSSCPPSITVRGADAMAFLGDVRSRLLVSCPGGGPAEFSMEDGFTIAECPFYSRYSKVWSSSDNAPGCAALAPVNATVERTVDGALLLGAITLRRATDNVTLEREMSQGVRLVEPTSFSNVQITPGGPLVDMILQQINLDRVRNIKALPVIVRHGANICKYGYMCQEGSCTNARRFSGQDYSEPQVCVEFGYEAIAPTPCMARSNGTGESCGMNCTSLTCTTMCPGSGNDCSMPRACMTTDTNAILCQECQCPITFPGQGCSQASGGKSLFASVSLLLTSLFALSMVLH